MPDIIQSINTNKLLKVRNPSSIRPWQHVIEPLMGYLLLAEAQYKNFSNEQHTYNFGPIMRSFKKFKFKISKLNKFKETKVLRLDSLKSQKKLKWKSVWDLKTSLKKVFEWNFLFKKGLMAKNICEKQFIMYLNKK